MAEHSVSDPECKCNDILPDKLCEGHARLYVDREERDNNFALHQIWEKLRELSRSVCDGCRQGIAFQDEMVGPAWYVHIGWGKCKAYQFKMVASALDDLRDQHFNQKFNPEKVQRLGNLCLLCHLTVDGEHR